MKVCLDIFFWLQSEIQMLSTGALSKKTVIVAIITVIDIYLFFPEKIIE